MQTPLFLVLSTNHLPDLKWVNDEWLLSAWIPYDLWFFFGGFWHANQNRGLMNRYLPDFHFSAQRMHQLSVIHHMVCWSIAEAQIAYDFFAIQKQCFVLVVQFGVCLHQCFIFTSRSFSTYASTVFGSIHVRLLHQMQIFSSFSLLAHAILFFLLDFTFQSHWVCLLPMRSLLMTYTMTVSKRVDSYKV